MLFSVLGYAFRGGNNEEDNIKELNYNGFEFVEQNGFWFTNIENFQFIFRYNPEQVEKIPKMGVDLIDIFRAGIKHFECKFKKGR